MRATAIIQARMSSTRFPGKVLKPILGRPMLQRQIERVTRAKTLDQIIIATTTNLLDASIAKLTDKLGLLSYRGSATDVLDRFYQAAKKYQADVIVRLTGDCPLIDPQIIDQVVTDFQSSRVDYASNHHVRSFPVGMDTEVISLQALTIAWEKAHSAYDREHVTPYIYNPANNFRLKYIVAPLSLRQPQLRLTVDTPADLKLVRKIYQLLYSQNPHFSLQDIIQLLHRQSELTRINRQVTQKSARYYRTL